MLQVFQTMKEDKAALKQLNLESLPDLKVLSLHGKVPHPKRIEIFNQFQDLKVTKTLEKKSWIYHSNHVHPIRGVLCCLQLILLQEVLMYLT